VRALLLVMLIAGVAMGVTGFVVFRSMAKQLPDPDIRKAKGRDQSTVITDRRNKVLVRLFAEQNRQDVALEAIPRQVRNAVVATEDERFYEHEGVDPMSIARAVLVDLQKGEAAQGGSTITQQYVKQAFVTSEKTLKRKVQEAILAQRVEKQFSKDEILALYLNTIYFGHGAYGVEAASQAYFGKSVGKLSIPEAAVIAGVIKSPARYSPYLKPDNALKRRNTVLAQMKRQGYIDDAEYQAAIAKPIKLAGLKPSSARAPYFVEWVKENLVREYGERKVYRGGLRVQTTIDPNVQSAAERAIASVLNRPGDPSAALVALDPKTGQVLAMVGGRDFKKEQFNVAVQGKRQPGSAFKPFVLATALSEGVCPEKAFPSGARTLAFDNQQWKVTGHGGPTSTMRLRPATEKSVNAVFAQLILDVGPENVVETAKKMGISEKITPVPAIALGGLERGVSPLEMANAYGTLANGGKRATPDGIIKVSDSSQVYEKGKPRLTDAIDPAVAYLTTNILSGVITRGTGRAANIGRSAAGKTGTTQEYRDAWFVGYTPDLVCAVWVGYPESQREMKSVHGRQVTGGSFPAEIWARFMKAALANKPKTNFVRPKGIIQVTVCDATGGLASEYCTKTVAAIALAQYPPEPCTLHVRPVQVSVPSVIGMTKLKAIARIEQALLKVRIVDQPVPGIAAGVVFKQTPSAATSVAPDTVVTIIVSSTGANKPPVAQFSFPPGNIKAGQSVPLDASASTDDGQIVRYYWEFDDDQVGNGVKTSHVWVAGTYQVTLWVTDDKGEQASVMHTIVVK
jgi:penicillin-binding protein 1A